MTLANSLSDYVRACCSGIWIQSHEHEDAIADISRLCAEQHWHLATWDIEQGLQLPGHTEESTGATNDPLAAIRAVNALATPVGAALLVLGVWLIAEASVVIVRTLRSGRRIQSPLVFCSHSTILSLQSA